ncbi:coenzyme F420-dependent NADP oxidoreductase [Corallococcus coralloides DSM 2259]|uniref:Coenzyme F420-dependent NADP oxidoreductase n=2 Tax=Corallococcus coralloides TaxID=184914 RepID=H8MPE6_CORCM|nr:coenzyme F420-dependent NADP oxidoreductase [Corallococcus coralloides DSM 2259]
MKIGIIGAGLIGGTLARRWTRLGHEVSIANSRGPDTLRDLAKETGAKAVTVEEAAKAGEVVVVTIPQKAVPDLPKGLFANVPKDVVIIDTGNYYPVRDGQIPDLLGGATESEWVASHLGRPVIKAFNNIFFQSLLDKGLPKGAPGRVALPVAGDPPEHRAKVLKLVEELGFDAIDAGSLADSWRQQPGTPVYTHDFDAPGVKKALAEAERSRLPEYRKKADDSLRAFFASQK